MPEETVGEDSCDGYQADDSEVRSVASKILTEDDRCNMVGCSRATLSSHLNGLSGPHGWSKWWSIEMVWVLTCYTEWPLGWFKWWSSEMVWVLLSYTEWTPGWSRW